MSAPTPPPAFIAQLLRYDPLLRLRWGRRSSIWLIERRMPPRHRDYLAAQPSPFRSPRGLDLFDGWREGYLHVLSVHPTLLDERVFEVLAEADAHRQGGWGALNRRLDAIQEADEATADRTIATWNEGAAREMHDLLAWMDGRRVSCYVPPERVEQGDGFVIRERRPWKLAEVTDGAPADA